MQPFQFVEFVDRRFDSIDFEHFCQNCAVLLFNRADTKNSFIGFCYIPLVSQKDWRISSSRHDGDVFDKLVDSGELNIYIYMRYSKKITIRISTWKPCLNGQWVCRLSRICYELWNFSTFTRGKFNISKYSNVVITSWYWHVIPDLGHRIKSGFFWYCSRFSASS